MVDVNQISQLLKTHFWITKGKVQIDPDTGVVNVEGSVRLKHSLSQLPVTFGEVWGYFDCARKSLTTLQGAPRLVGGNFFCESNKLTHLQGSPDHVIGDFFCDHNQLTSLHGACPRVDATFLCNDNPLTSLEGAPEHVGDAFVVDYSAHLPLLRLLMYKEVELHAESPPEIQDLLNKYAGKGKKGAIPCAAELIRAGFRENARW